MKYFTKELWLGYNDRGPLDSKTAIELGERNMQEYIAQLERLRPRLSQQTYYFFKEENLHDGRLLEFLAGDGVGHDIHSSPPFDINAHNSSVTMRLLGADLDLLYTLTYSGVRKALFDFPSDDPLFHDEGGHIGDWGYDELTAVDDAYLRHEVLFASGTIIQIEFKHFSYNKEPCEGTRYQGRS
jgi:hypothetical protein